ncbi:hypothetical protein P7K49_010153, partial [Saguinus oedipus]
CSALDQPYHYLGCMGPKLTQAWPCPILPLCWLCPGPTLTLTGHVQSCPLSWTYMGPALALAWPLILTWPQ